MKNGKLVATLGAVALVAAIGLGSTLAYLTAETKTVTNTFTIGNVNFEENLGGGLVESKVERDANDKYVDADGKDTWTSVKNDYTSLYPGENVYKDPTVIMAADSEDAWVFAKVVYNKDQYTVNYTNGWEVVAVGLDNSYDIVAKKEIIKASQNSTIFDSVTVSTDVDQNTELENIVVSAAAVQAAGLDRGQAQQQAVDLLVPAVTADNN